MAMTFSFHDQIEFADTGKYPETTAPVSFNSSISDERIHLFAEKMCIPKIKKHILRPRLTKLLEKSSEQFGATLITGRAETGKTIVAADFAENYERVVWYRIESAESDWNLFSRYFLEMFGNDFGQLKELKSDAEIFVENLLAKISAETETPLLIVLDDIHNVFDAVWFTDFFVRLLVALTPHIHLLMLSRTKPPQPLWRLRSKQILGVIDEKLLAFNVEETKELFKKHKISAKLAARTQSESFGRISRLKHFIEKFENIRKKKPVMT